ncbi:Copia protein [Symbiodinium microadriaticum]|uniref:Copia protein n=1 Tax=Symbiodinium microadriaticum TaxID=2951 RepID=A0A1Q9E810_SYMMI|nr:Copia protein [Symbiodinium microadriaticum]
MAAAENEPHGAAVDPWAQWQGVGQPPAEAPNTTEQGGEAQEQQPRAEGSHDQTNDSAPTTTTAWDDSQWTPADRTTHGWNWDSWSDSSWRWGAWWGSQDWTHCTDPWSAARDPWSSSGNRSAQNPQHEVGSQGSRDGDHSSNEGASGHTDEPTTSTTRSGASATPGTGDRTTPPPATRSSTTGSTAGHGDEGGGPCLTAWYTGETPKSGPSERMAVPTFSAEGSGEALGLSARSYLRQMDAWCKITRAPANQRALLLYQSLGGRAWVEAEELSVEDLGTDNGVSILKAWIQERYQEIEVSKIAETLTQFFRKLRRQQNQTVREFNSAFDRAYARLLEIDCKLPEVAKAWVYLSALNLSNTEELSLLASVNNEYVTSKLQKAATLHEKSLQAPWRRWSGGGHQPGGGDRGRPTRGAYLTEIPEDGDEDFLESDAVLPEEEAAELHEAYMAQEAAKTRFREMNRSRGYGGTDGKDDGKSAAERLQLAKSRSYCAGCKRRGHWHRDPECPLNSGRTPGTADSAGTKKNEGPKDAYVVHVAYEVGDWNHEGLYAITDCACSRTVAGEGWLQQYLEVSRRHGLREQLLPCSEDFRFGASRLFHANYTEIIVIDPARQQYTVYMMCEIGEVQVRSGRKLIVETSSPPEAHWHRLITNLFKKYIVKAIPHGYKYEIHVFDPIRDGEAQEVWVAEHEGRDPMPPEVTGASAITFSGTVAAPIKAALTRLHQNLGHPSVSDLTRHLRFAGAEDKVIAAAKGMRCQTCDRTKKVAASRPASIPSFLDFNALVSVDVFHVFDAKRKRHELLSVIDHATTYHLVAVLTGHSTGAFEKGFVELWGRAFGAPRVIAADLESGLQKALARYTDFTGSKLRSKAGQAHWQQGVIERHGGWYKEILNRVIDEHSVQGEEIHLAVAAVNAAKNELRRKHGFSPAQAVFGKDPACPEELLCGRDEGQYLELVTEDRQRQKEIAIRNAAKAAFFRTQVDTKFRRSLLQRARVKHGAYAPGQMVCFFRIEKVATKRGQWRGPGLILGGEGGNWWISHGGRCYLTAEEHMRPATAEEIGDLMNSRVARADLEKLLAGDRDDPDNYDPDEEEPTEVNPGAMEVEDEDMNLDLAPGDPDPEGPEKPSDETPPYGPVRQRARTKKPQPHTANMLKKCQTERSREKQYEKEIPWSMIPPERHADFKAAEIKQLKEHYDLNAFTPLTKRESEEVYAETSKDRILTCRWAYRDKNWSRRRQDASVEWKPKARLVVGGHLDPDIGDVKTDAPTISRLGLLSILQAVASHQRDEKPWTASAGDVSAAFLNGQPIKRLLYMKQPKTGFPDMEPGALLKIEKNIFGLVDSPREWWTEFRDTVLAKEIEYGTDKYYFKQSPLDSCMFFLIKADDPDKTPCAYIGVHVDDVLVAAEAELSKAIQQGLSQAFPISDWETNDFEFLGCKIRVGTDGVRIDQEHYTCTRLFEIPVDKSQHDMESATEEQRIDNQSLVGALSWLGSQTRPDLVCGVSMAQQLQKAPTAGDIRFTNMLAKRAEAHREKGIWLKPVSLDDYEIFVYHDSAWANASLELSGEDHFALNEDDHVRGEMTGTPYDFKERKAKRANSKVASQYGIMILIADRHCFAKGGGECSLLEWRSAAGKRVCRSTFAAETMACCEGLEAGQFVRSFLATTFSGKLRRIEELYGNRLHCFSDCRSLYDHVHRQGLPRIPSDKRLAVDLAAIRQMIDREQQNGRELLHWVPTNVQLADILTKPMVADNWWKMMSQKRVPTLYARHKSRRL